MNRSQRAALAQRIAVVILTHNRCAELHGTLKRMTALPVVPAIVVVDNDSTDATCRMVPACFPHVRFLSLPRNLGAAARNAGVEAVDTDYVAFCDDDTWWEDGALESAVAVLDAHPDVAVLCARVLVGREDAEDPTCAVMAASPLPAKGLPGPALLGFLAGASVIRRDAFLAAGGYEPKLFIGAEEDLLALDLASRGWGLSYVPELVVHHHPSAQRDSDRRKKDLARNALWICWMRLPLAMATRRTSHILRTASLDGVLAAALADAVPGLPWVLARRKVIPPQVARWHALLHREHGCTSHAEWNSGFTPRIETAQPDPMPDMEKRMDDFVVSVVVPTCGRPELLNRCIEALCRQTLDASRYDVIIVDDRPHPRTEEIVAAWRGPGRPTLTYLPNHGPHGPAAARNRGWQASRSDIIAFTDDDTIPTAAWLENGLSVLGTQGEALRGRIVMPLEGTPTDYERDAKQLETADFVTANCLCRKTVLEKLGGFDERFRMAWREDSDLYFRMLDLGIDVIDAPDAVVVHPVRPAPWGVSISQQKKILFDALLYKKHPHRYRQKIRSRARWDYYGTVAMLLATPLGLAVGHVPIAIASAAAWIFMTARFCMKRLRGTSRSVSHVVEMVVTSAVIPPCALFWRMVGALRFHVPFT